MLSMYTLCIAAHNDALILYFHFLVNFNAPAKRCVHVTGALGMFPVSDWFENRCNRGSLNKSFFFRTCLGRVSVGSETRKIDVTGVIKSYDQLQI